MPRHSIGDIGKKRSCAAIFAAFCLLLLGGAGAFADQKLPLKILVLPIPGSPQFFEGDGKSHVAYELVLANFTESPVRVDSLRVSGSGGKGKPSTVVATFSGDQLKSIFSSIAGKYLIPQDPMLKPGEAGMLFLFLDLPSRETLTLSNQLEVEVEGKPETRQSISPHEMAPDGAPVVMASPLRGDHWWTPNGPANDSIHRRIVIALGNHFGLPERFAVDWIKLGDDGQSFTGDEHDNRSYHAYNAEVIAVADGQVISIKDGIPENVPNSSPMAVPITLETIGGNNVVEDLGGGKYAFYAHLIPGTIAVKPGDRVKRGQLLGRLGNSGNSTEPHLHFHVCDAPDPLFSNGLPFEIDHFTRYDYTLEMKDEKPVKFVLGAPHQVSREIFMNRDLGDFGK